MYKYLIFDTETTGLNIVHDTPFLFQYGLADANLNLVSKHYFKADDIASKQQFIAYLKQINTYVGANIKFDIHMLINAGIDINIFEDKNFIDVMVLARLVIPHDKQNTRGGVFKIGLKDMAVQYLGTNAKDEDRKLRAELSQLTLAHKQQMKEYFIQEGVWTWNDKNNTIQTRVLNEIYNNWHKHFHKYTALADVRAEFLEKYPAPTYADVANVITYGMKDIDLTHGLFKLWYPQIVVLKQIETLKRVSAATLPLIYMEREGLTIDIDKVMQDREAIIAEMQRVKLFDPRTNEPLTVGQHARLKQVYEYESGMLLNSSDKTARSEILDVSPTARKVDYLSRLEKYLSTYVNGIIRKISPDNKVYTQYNLAGTITGRLSSDFQQFPKEAFTMETGHVINVRSWFIIPQDATYMFYFDYSQLELRLQCEWTAIINGSPDTNLARAFYPYKCVENNGKYYYEEDRSIEWTPTDLHSLTASNAFPDVDRNDPDWDHYRSLGKRTNFAVNYGASAPRISEALNVDMQTAQALVDGYRQAFPGVVAFGKWIGRRVYSTSSIPNLFLRRYYSTNKHQLQNWLVQGSGADLLLIKLREVYNYIKDKPHWKLLITVHDEIGFTCADIPEAQLRKEVADIKQLLSYRLTAVDVIADVEYTTTNWANKEDWK